MKEEKILFYSSSYKLVGLISFPKRIPAPGVILFHGLTNAKQDCPLINEVTQMLQEEDFATFRFDFFGSGESPGLMKEKTMDMLEQNARDSIDFFTKTGKISSLGIWGRSLGGTLIALIGNDPRVKASVIATGQIMIEKAMKERFPHIQELEKMGTRLPGTGRFKGEFELEKAWYDSLQGIDKRIEMNLRNLHTVLVLHTTPDQKVPLDNATKIINLVGEPKEIQIFEGVDHDYKGVEGIAVGYVKNWFKKYLT